MDCIKEMDISNVTLPIGLLTTVLKPLVWNFERRRLGFQEPVDSLLAPKNAGLRHPPRPGGYVHFFYTVYGQSSETKIRFLYQAVNVYFCSKVGDLLVLWGAAVFGTCALT